MASANRIIYNSRPHTVTGTEIFKQAKLEEVIECPERTYEEGICVLMSDLRLDNVYVATHAHGTVWVPCLHMSSCPPILAHLQGTSQTISALLGDHAGLCLSVS